MAKSDVYNNVLGKIPVEVEEQSDGSVRQVVKIANEVSLADGQVEGAELSSTSTAIPVAGKDSFDMTRFLSVTENGHLYVHEEDSLQTQILRELKKISFQMAILTDTHLRDSDIGDS